MWRVRRMTSLVAHDRRHDLLRECAVVVSLVVVVACTRTTGPSEPTIQADDASTPVKTTASASPSPTPSTNEAGILGDRCEVDADCGWDDPCVPKVCLRTDEKVFVGCDKSSLPPGTCTCIDHRCTLLLPR